MNIDEKERIRVKFKEFLRERHLYTEFINEALKYQAQEGKSANEFTLWQHLYHYHPSDWLDAALTWSETKRGRNFWATMCQEWSTYVYNGLTNS